MGLLDSNKTRNPNFAEYNRVIIHYCDGASFSGDASSPVTIRDDGGRPRLLYLRGVRVLRAVLDELAASHKLGSVSALALRTRE